MSTCLGTRERLKNYSKISREREEEIRNLRYKRTKSRA